MSSHAPSQVPPSADVPVAVDRQDERLQQAQGFAGQTRRVLDRVRAGELGLLPVFLGLVVIWAVLQSLNPLFLSSQNLVNLLMESVPTGILALGIVAMLLVGEIDLSVGSVSGLSSAILGVLFVERGLPVVVAITAAILAGLLVGVVYSALFNRFGVPSFVITLAGLLAFEGLQLKVLGSQGSINLPFDSALVNFAQLAFVPAWLSYVLVVVAAAVVLGVGLAHDARRRRAGLSGRSTTGLVIRSLLLLVVLGFGVWYLNRTRGVGWMVVLYIVLVAIFHYLYTRSRWGRSLFAVGGNEEAARRAGINVKHIYRSAFLVASTLAAVGGILAAARLAASNQSSGQGDVNLNAIAAAVIGGTSLFGGRGSAYSALLGILVIQSISNGLTLLNLDSAWRFVVTGVVLVLAVSVDAVARRSRASHGRA